MSDEGKERESPDPKRRPWLRYSLRTLLIVVVSYAALWTLTSEWGCLSFEKSIGGSTGERLLPIT